MKPLISTSILCLFVCCATAQFRRDVRNCPIPDSTGGNGPDLFIMESEGCCCFNVWQYDSNSTPGRFSYDDGDSALYIHKQNMAGNIVDGLLDQMCAGSMIKIYNQSDPTKFVHFKIVGMVSSDPIFDFVVTIEDSNGDMDKFADFCFEFDANCTAPPDCLSAVSGSLDAGVCAYPPFVQVYANDGSYGLGVEFMPDDIMVTSSDTTFGGIHYQSDYSENFTDRSLPDVAYVRDTLLKGYVPLAGTAGGDLITGMLAFDAPGTSLAGIYPLSTGVGMGSGGPGGGPCHTGAIETTCDQGVHIFSGDSTYANDMYLGHTSTIITSYNNIGDTTTVQIEPGSFTIRSAQSVKYDADCSASYTNRSLIDKGYLDATLSAMQIPNIPHANSGDIVTKFNLLLDYLVAEGLMAP